MKMRKTRDTLSRFVPRLLCRSKGHDWKMLEDVPAIGGGTLRSAYCRRNCGLPDAFRAERINP